MSTNNVALAPATDKAATPAAAPTTETEETPTTMTETTAPTTETAPVPTTAPESLQDAPVAAFVPTSMRLLRDDLHAALVLHKVAVAGRCSLPILGYVRLTSDRDVFAMRLQTTNLETSLESDVPMLSGGLGDVAVPYKELAAAVRAMPRGAVLTLAMPTAATVKVSCDGASYSLPTLPVEEWPIGQFLTVDDSGIADSPRDGWQFVDGSHMAQSLARVLPAAAIDFSRPVLNTVHMTPTMLETADGFRLHQTTWNGLDGINAIIARDSVVALLKAKPVGDTRIQENDNRAMIAFRWYRAVDRPVTLTGRIVDGQFPDLNRVVPRASEAQTTLTLAPRILAAAASQLAAGMPKSWRETGTMQLRVTATDERTARVSLLAHSTETGLARVTVGTFPSTGDDLRIGLNVSLLVDALNASSDSLVVLRFRGPLSPLSVQDGLGYSAVVMPMHQTNGSVYDVPDSEESEEPTETETTPDVTDSSELETKSGDSDVTTETETAVPTTDSTTETETTPEAPDVTVKAPKAKGRSRAAKARAAAAPLQDVTDSTTETAPATPEVAAPATETETEETYDSILAAAEATLAANAPDVTETDSSVAPTETTPEGTPETPTVDEPAAAQATIGELPLTRGARCRVLSGKHAGKIGLASSVCTMTDGRPLVMLTLDTVDADGKTSICTTQANVTVLEAAAADYPVRNRAPRAPRDPSLAVRGRSPRAPRPVALVDVVAFLGATLDAETLLAIQLEVAAALETLPERQAAAAAAPAAGASESTTDSSVAALGDSNSDSSADSASDAPTETESAAA